ncbi:MAG: hypothetical protein PHZ11_04120 [Desulfitobacteriaceae bacterium]|nr:hypothetical protein [Desulfitobacteriaceae bacterium]MDD4346078.1 hypothetical protein [Desulfitobacteriaceae bacterium]MDD4400907.1 hypothetical protein [Desulfitobacteriaceae bacterium]
MDKYQELLHKIQGKTIDFIITNKYQNNRQTGFDLVFTDGSVLELYAEDLYWAFVETLGD